MFRARVVALVAAVVLATSWLTADADITLSYAPLHHPFRNAKLFVDTRTAAARWQAAHGAAWLDRITHHPQAIWLTSPPDVGRLPELVQRANAQRALLVLVVYYIPDRDCAGPWAGAPSGADYDRFVEQLASALGPSPAAIVMEPDSVAAACFNRARAELLKRGVRRLAKAGHHVYLDAGHPNWRSAPAMARRLRASGIADAEGFSVNVANRQTTAQCYRWARDLSRRVGHRDFVIDTSRNGIGPPPDLPGRYDEWCNPGHEGLGQEPTTKVRRRGLAALLWIKPPGESDGACGGESGNHFSPRQARNLIRNARGK